MSTSTIKTRLLIISDTHGENLNALPTEPVDVAIHCGDLTEESKLEEFRTSIQLLESLNAPLKLVIAGNHDFTLDTPMFKKKLEAIKPPLEDQLVKKQYGSFGEARDLFESREAKAAGIVFLEEGTHRFEIANGAVLTVYASPYTPSLNDWGFQYSPQQGHDWRMDGLIDVAITHGPPRGILDYTDSRTRAGCPSLFAAVARARPRLHCFGHIHEGWGAKQVTWREEPSEAPSHFADINNDESAVIANLLGLTVKSFDLPTIVTEKTEKLHEYTSKGYCTADAPPHHGHKTLFVNASIEGSEVDQQQFLWVVDIDLPAIEDNIELRTTRTSATESFEARQDVYDMIERPRDRADLSTVGTTSRKRRASDDLPRHTDKLDR